MSLVVAWQLKNKKVLIIGGGEVAQGRVELVQKASASVTVIAPEIDERVKNCQVIKREFELADITNEYEMVLSAVDDRTVSRQIYQRCKELKIPVNVADMPPECDFYFGSMINRGPLQVMVSTNGNAPRLAKRVRELIEDRVDELGVDVAIEKVGDLRQRLREKTVPNDENIDTGYEVDTIKTRMKWISNICDDWSFNQMASLTDEQLDAIVDKYPGPCSWEDIISSP